MELSQSFQSGGWTVKYGIFDNTQDPRGVVLFVHGTPWSSAVFKPLAKALIRQRYQIILYDLAGYEQSQRLQHNQPVPHEGNLFSGDTSVRMQAQILSDLFQHLQLNADATKRPAVIAHDIAGAIVLRAHLLHNCSYRSLLLFDTNAVLPWGDGFYQLVRSEAPTFIQLPVGIFHAIVRAVIRSASYKPESMSSEWEDVLTDPWIDNDPTISREKQHSFVRQIAQANDEDVAEMLRQELYVEVKCPVKIMWGEHDKWIPKAKLDKLATMLDGMVREFVVIPEAGHLIMVDQPERVAIETFDWLLKN